MITLFSEEQIMEAYEKEVYNDGVERGSDQRANMVAHKMIESGYPDDEVARICELSREEIEEIKKEMGK